MNIALATVTNPRHEHAFYTVRGFGQFFFRLPGRLVIDSLLSDSASQANAVTLPDPIKNTGIMVT